MRFNPFNIHRSRVSDGQGGWTISDAVDAYCFGQFHYGMPDTEFFCGADEDVRIDDVLDIESRYYIVRECMSAHNAPIRKWRIELTDRPQFCPSTTTAPATTTGAATTTAGNP